MASLRVFPMRSLVVFLLAGVMTCSLSAQTSSSAPSSSSTAPARESASSSTERVRRGQPEAGGASITLETNEAVFDIATALNVCGYDADLPNSNPVRAKIRAEVGQLVSGSPQARVSQDALCQYIQQHDLSDKARDLAQYVSLALYLGPPPQLAPIAEETEMPPDALQVINMVPLLRTFADAVSLHSVWLNHRPEYEAITSRVHEPVTQMILEANAYLKVPVSSYDGRRMLIFVEPMFGPNAPNARIYSTDYVLVTSPNAAGAIRMDQIRHLYLHYEIEPLVYARASSMARLTPLLKAVQSAPLDFVYKSDVVALVTECLIKAIEARTMEVGFPAPTKPTGTRARMDLARYNEEFSAYERRAEVVRRKQVDLDMRQGWVLVDYFYGKFQMMERSPEGLGESMGEMVYGMDVGRERHRDEQIQFLPEGSGEFVRRAPRMPTGILLAEKKMLEGDLNGAEAIADKALADPKQDHPEALYVKSRIELMQGDPESSMAGFEQVLKTAKSPQTLAWAHIYLGRLYDTKAPAERGRALTEYKAAKAVAGVNPDALEAAEKGLKSPFSVPTTVHQIEEPIDPSGKAEKDAYRPDDPK